MLFVQYTYVILYYITIKQVRHRNMEFEYDAQQRLPLNIAPQVSYYIHNEHLMYLNQYYFH